MRVGYQPGGAADSIAAATGQKLKVKVFAIPPWDMDTVGFKDITHGLTLAKIIHCQAWIINDAATELRDLMVGSHGTVSEGSLTDKALVVTVARRTGGYYDNVNYNSTVSNRGFLTVWYTE